MNENVKDLLSESSVADLEHLVKEAKKQIEARKEQEINDARIHVRELAASLGITLEELLVKPTKPVRVGKAIKKAEIKYRNPNNEEETWAGRGKKPTWLKEAIDGGATLEDFAV